MPSLVGQAENSPNLYSCLTRRHN